jgi:hypothetical protein
MKTTIRVIILFLVLFGIIGLARNQVAWAADPSGGSDQAALSGSQDSVLSQRDDDCDEPENKDRPRCQDKKKDKDKCKKNPKHCGSVKPPPIKIIIPVTGEYSVGGLCTLSTVLNDPGIRLDASIVTPLPKSLPHPVLNVHQGCLLEYTGSGQHLDELPSSAGQTTICFAAPPGKEITIYFYDRSSSNPAWAALATTADAGRACAPANASGVYAASSVRH